MIKTLGSSVSQYLKLYDPELITKAVILSVALNSEYPSVCWMIPPGFRYFTFDEEVKIPSGKYWMPTLIFKLNENELDVIAANDNIWTAYRKFQLDDYEDLYLAPVLNMTDETSNCMGNAKPPEEINSINDIINAWTENFFAAQFNAIHENLKIPIDKYYEHARTKQPFRKEWFKPYGENLNHFCS